MAATMVPVDVTTRPITSPLRPSSSSASSVSSASSSTHHATPDSNNLPSSSRDLEKAPTAPDTTAAGNGLTSTTSARVTRIQSITRRRAYDTQFSHPLAHTKTSQDVIVDFDGPDDPYRPINWPYRKKVLTTILYGLTTMGATFASSVYSPAVDVVAQEYGVGSEVSILGLSLLLAGFGLGPLLWGPISEIYGRKPAVLVPYFLGAIFSFGTGAGKDIQTILITRFFTGIFGSAPVTNTGACCRTSGTRRRGARTSCCTRSRSWAGRCWGR